MEIDLHNTPELPGPIRSQVCIVGGGIAGIVLAHRLHELGVETVLLEAGGRRLRADQQSALAQVQLHGQQHEGTRSGRFRVFGGAAVRWGGQLLPLPADARGWPVTAAELAPFAVRAERLLGVDTAPYAASQFFAEHGFQKPAWLDALNGVETLVSKWTPFTRRNLAITLGRTLRASSSVRIFLRAQATEVLLAQDGTRIAAVLVRRPDGGTLQCNAEQFVVAAGTVETVRLLLASRNLLPGGIGNKYGQLGRNFHDHLTLPAGVARGATRERMIAELRPWIIRSARASVGATAHSAKLVATAALCGELHMHPVLAHMTIDEPEDAGAGVLRTLLLTRQRGGFLSGLRRHATALPEAMIDALRLLWEAQIDRRRFVSRHAQVRIYLNAAQDAPSSSRITLAQQTDAAGVPLPVVDWRVTPREIATLRSFAARLRAALQASGLDEIDWDPALFDPSASLPSLDDARHAMGGAVMGEDARTSVVDPQLRVHGIDNLSIASAAVFPNGAPPLPTLPLMALSLRLADRLAKRFAA